MKLLKFRTCSNEIEQTRLIEIIKTNSFWYDASINQNDLFDVSPIISSEFGYDDFSSFISYRVHQKEISTAIADKFRSEWIAGRIDLITFKEVAIEASVMMLDGFRTKMSFCSFSDISELKNPRLWGMYSASGSGCAIEIDTPGTLDTANTAFHRVKYEGTRPILRLSEIFDAITIEGKFDAFISKTFATKYSIWNDENEIRHLLTKDPCTRSIGQITSIYFGPKMLPEIKHKIISITRETNQKILFFDMIPSKSNYEMDAIQLR